MNELPRNATQPGDLPQTELNQPDPQLSLSAGKASGLQIALVALGCVFILGLMIYGLNRPMVEPGQVASAPPATETTGAAPPAPPAADRQQVPQAAPPQNEPAQQPQPEPVKPAQPDDPQR